MYANMMSKEERRAFNIYLKFRDLFPNANIDVLRQISVYIARCNFSDEIYENIKFKYLYDSDNSLLVLNNGIEIEFNDFSGEFGFVVRRNDGNFSSNTIVSLNDSKDKSSVNIYSELRVKGYGMYVVTFRPKNLSDINSLKYGTINYYTDDEIEWVMEYAGDDVDNNFDIVAKNNGIYPFADKSEFELVSQPDISLDSYQGYISNVLMRIDLLYDNMKFIRIKRKKHCK